MASAAALKIAIETALARRIPAALTPRTRIHRLHLPTGIPAVDDLIGGFPLGAITELTGPESSGRTSLALSFIAQTAQRGSVCAWVDASDSFHGGSAAAAGVDLTRLLWVRCGVYTRDEQPGYTFAVRKRYMQSRAPKRGLHGGGFGPHPRTETKRLSEAMGELFQNVPQPVETAPVFASRGNSQPAQPGVRRTSGKPWGRIEQALKATDLILQAGGFSAVVLDLGGVAPEYVSRVELSMWFHYRAAVERLQASFVLLTKHHVRRARANCCYGFIQAKQAMTNPRFLLASRIA